MDTKEEDHDQNLTARFIHEGKGSVARFICRLTVVTSHEAKCKRLAGWDAGGYKACQRG